jgi:hypothetical protein
MRKDPVASLIRILFFSGIYSSEWTFAVSKDGVPQDWVELIRSQLESKRRQFLSVSALGCFDFGWQAFEKVFENDPITLQTRLKKLKPLLQDNTEILDDPDTGAFYGLRQGDVELGVPDCLLCNFDVEGTMHEGSSTLANMEMQYDVSSDLHDTARRYDKKMAGAHWVVRFPIGVTETFRGASNIPNEVVASEILKSLQASGMIALPISRDPMSQLPSDQRGGWDIELISANGASVDFSARYEYLDKCKARSLGFPERAILEGLHGTKAEAESHGDFALSMIEYRHSCLLEILNWHCVDQILRLNYGESAQGAVKVVATPLDDQTKSKMWSLYDKILSQPDGMMQELDAIDIDEVAEILGVPRKVIENVEE